MATALLLLAILPGARAATYVVGPDDYLAALERLQPGDTLALQAGEYGWLPVHDIVGTAEAPIHIAGPESGTPAVIRGRRGKNIVSIANSKHVTIRNLHIDGTEARNGDGVKAEGNSRFAHYITLSNLVIENLTDHQQVVGISTKCPARGWIVRENEIRNAGTGMYFGRSNGNAPFVGGLIEHNLVTGSIGYALQIKHQEPRPTDVELPTGRSMTVVRHNVFAKDDRSSTGRRARPNVLLGHFPESGPGSSDRYAVYGNLFYNNPTERLFQGEGDIALYDNLFVNPAGDALAIQPHHGDPRRIAIFHNTIVARDTGIWFRKTERTELALVRGNAVLAGRPFSGNGANPGENLSDDHGRADEYLRKPFAEPGSLDLTPAGDRLAGSVAIPPDVLWDLPDVQRDFDGVRRSGDQIGAYEGAEDQPYWTPQLSIKPRPSASRTGAAGDARREAEPGSGGRG